VIESLQGSLDTPEPRNYIVHMKARLIQIGNSRGIRIPKALLEQTHLTEDVHIEAQAGEIVIRSARLPRGDWEEAFLGMAQRGDDQLLDEARRTAFDETEWEW
jgi:antitoxin MazE